MDEYLENDKERKKVFKNYKKGIKKIILGLLLLGVGLAAVPGSFIADVLTAIPFVSSELAVLVAVLVKAGLMVGGALKTIVGLIKSNNAEVKINNLNEIQQELVESMQFEINHVKEKNRELEEENQKLNGKRKERTVTSRAKAAINRLENDYEYQEEAKHKVKM